MHINDTTIYWGLSVLIIIILYIFVIIKDKSTKKRMNSYESSIEHLNKTIYRLEKNLEEKIDLIKSEIKTDIKDPLFSSLENIKQDVDQTSSTVNTRVGNLEEKTKEYMSVPVKNFDEQMAISMFKSGQSVAEIAKELRCNESEISFLLKVRGLA